MRLSRLSLTLLAVFAAFIGGSPYYATIFPIRIAAHVLFTLAAAGWLIARLRRGRGLPATPLTGPLLAMAAVWLLTSALAPDARMAFEHTWLLLLHTLIVLFIGALLLSGRQRLAWEIQFMLAAVVVILAGLQFGSFLFGWGITPETGAGWLQAGRPPITPMLYLPLGVSTWLAAYCAPLCLLAFAWSLTAARRDERLALRVLAGLLLLVLLGTTSRGGLLALGAAVLIFGVLQYTRRLRARIGVLALLAPAAALVAVVAALILIIGRSGARSAGDVLRLSLWQSAAAVITEHPLAGVGPGGFARAMREVRDPTVVDDRLGTAHNIALNTLAETGLPGALVLAWAALAGVRAWWRLRAQTSGGYRLRLDAAMAALAGLAVQSMVDMFTATPIVMLAALLAMTCTLDTRPQAIRRLREAPPSRSLRAAAAAALALVLAGGLLWVGSDRAQAAYLRSVQFSSLEAAQEAAALDPHLRLYRLQIAYLNGRAAQTTEQIDAAIAGHQAVLALEPTWDTGWINLAALHERRGDLPAAAEALEQADAINHGNGARYHIARLADAQGQPQADVEALYLQGMTGAFSPLWQATPARRAALEAVYAQTTPDVQYRLALAHFPERAATIPADEDSTPGMWLLGERALQAGDAAAAQDLFAQAAALLPLNADYAISLARALLPDLPGSQAQIEGLLARAQLSFGQFEQAGAVRAQMALALGAPLEVVQRYRLLAGPARVISQNFEGVLFGGRGGSFELYPEMRLPGPGSAAFAPWMDAAADAPPDQARAIYRAILDMAPEQGDARAALDRLEAAS